MSEPGPNYSGSALPPSPRNSKRDCISRLAAPGTVSGQRSDWALGMGSASPATSRRHHRRRGSELYASMRARAAAPRRLPAIKPATIGSSTRTTWERIRGAGHRGWHDRHAQALGETCECPDVWPGQTPATAGVRAV